MKNLTTFSVALCLCLVSAAWAGDEYGGMKIESAKAEENASASRGLQFSDEQIASVLTYIRREWEHTAAPVKCEIVKAVRVATAKREEGWSEAELLKIR